MQRMAIFIDAGYLSALTKQEFAGARIDFKLLVSKIAAGREILRTYFYDCLPYQSASPTPEEKLRFGKHQKFHSKLIEIPRFDIRLGRLEFRGYTSDGKQIFQQKRVDILLGVDLALLSAKHLITDAAVIAGDSDFLPAIEAAKSEGVVVHLYHGATPHKDLVAKCDERTRMDQAFMDSVRQKMSLL